MEDNLSGNKNNGIDVKRMLRFALYGLTAVIAIVVVVLIAGGLGETIAPSEDIGQVVASQFDKNAVIAEIRYDPQLTFASAGDVALANGKTWKPIRNNLFKKSKDGDTILFDETIVGRVIQFNSDWVYAQNEGDDRVLASLAEDSRAAEKLKEKGGAEKLAFHTLSIGEFARAGNRYYVLTKEQYTKAGSGVVTPVESVYVYQLIPAGDTLLISDFEELIA
ncbi:MAG: hypothetical protein LBO81_07130 [Clostridiales Family XIII bacterium]|nr:hypothetical protein [Clostridiales Family XIII bacterium]